MAIERGGGRRGGADGRWRRGRRAVRRSAGLLLAALLLTGCSAPPGIARGTAPGSASGPAAGRGGAPVTAGGYSPARFRRRPSARADCFLGVVTAAAAVDLAASAEGRLARLPVAVGEAVAAGQVVAALEADDLHDRLAVERAAVATAEAERRRALLEVEEARRAAGRNEALADLLAGQELEAARFALRAGELRAEAATARLEAARARLAGLQGELARSTLRAPFDGRVAALYHDPGAPLAQGTPILRLLASGRLLTRFAVPPKSAAAVAPGTPVRIEVESLRLTLQSEVASVAPELDTASRMVFAEAALPPELAATHPLLAGAVARVSLHLDGAHCVASEPERTGAPGAGS